MATIKMPATPKSAYDPKRPANTLLLTQARELEQAVVEAGRTVRRKKPKTEEQVALYIRHLNRALHQQVLLPPMARRPLDVPIDRPSRTASMAGAKKSRPPVSTKAAAGPRKRTAAASPKKKKPSRSRTRKRSRRS